MLKKNKALLIDLLFIFILSLTPLLWFRGEAIMVGHDNVFPLNPIEFLKGRFYTWSNQGLGQDQSLIMGTIPIHIIDSLPYILGFPLQTSQKIAYIFWFFLIGLSGYCLASVINKRSRLFKLSASVFYQFNFFILQGWFIGERTKFSAYISLPLILAVFLLVSRRKLSVLRAAIYNALILFLFNGGGVLGVPLFGGFLVTLFIFLLFFFNFALYQKNYLVAKNLFLTVVLSIFLVFLVNAYYFLPALTNFFLQYRAEETAFGGVYGLIKWAEEISIGSNFINLFRLQGMAEWYDNPDHPYAGNFLTNKFLIALSFLWPLLALLPLVMARQKEKLKMILFFFFVYLIGIFFVAGTHPPFGFLYSFLMKKIPGFVIFRSPYYKFAPTLFLANAFLMALFIDHWQGFLKKILFVLILSIWLVFHFPFFTGDFFAWQKNLSTRVKIPSYVFEMAHWVNQEKKEEGKILLLPPNSPAWQFDVYRWGYLSLFPLLRLTTQEPILVNDAQLTDSQNYLLGLVYQSLLEKDQDLFQKTTSLLGIKYLVLRNDVFWNLEWVASESPLLYQQVLPEFNSIKYLKKFGEWDLYEIEGGREVFSASSQISNLQMSVGDTKNYFSFGGDNFLVRDGHSAELRESLSPLITQSYLKAECLSCRHEKTPLFALPERVLVLPNSPFYFLVSLRDKMILKESAPKVAVYDYLGLSLKRLAEVRKFIQNRSVGQELKKEYLFLYHQALKKMNELFGQLSDFESQHEAAYNLEFYLKNEEDYLRVLLGEAVGNEEELKLFEETFKLISQLREALKPYLFEPDHRYKLYLLNLDQASDYQIFVRKEGLEGALVGGEEVKIVINDQTERSIKIDSPAAVADWLDFGKISLELGKHQLVMTLPALKDLALDFIEDDLQMRTQADRCYIASINEYDNRKAYKIEADYRGGLPNDFSMYSVSQKNGQTFRRTTKVGKEAWETTKEELIYPDEKVQEQQVGFCGPYLTLDLLKEKTSLKIYEIIHPLVIFVSEKQTTSSVRPEISFQKINPTKYVTAIKGANQPFILSFSEAFDARWQASVNGKSLKNHFIINGYANGWLIEKTGDYQVVIEYRPQKIFFLGCSLSGLTFLSSLVYLMRKRHGEL